MLYISFEDEKRHVPNYIILFTSGLCDWFFVRDDRRLKIEFLVWVNCFHYCSYPLADGVIYFIASRVSQGCQKRRHIKTIRSQLERFPLRSSHIHHGQDSARTPRPKD